MGRPSLYSPEIAETICKRLAEGESLRAVCRDNEMPSEVTVRRWVLDDHEGFSAQYTRAREAQAHAIADELLEISDDGSNDWMERNDKDNPGWQLNGEHVQRSKLRADTRKWLLAKMLPKVYGERLEVEATVRKTVSSEPLSEDEWATKYGAGMATAGGTTEGTG